MSFNPKKPFDLTIRNATVANASDLFRCDIGIINGRIKALADSLPSGIEDIDAEDKIITPGGVDSHCHMDQPMPDGIKMADDFASATLSAACGGTTTVIPFAVQEKGKSLKSAVRDYHRKASGNAHIDYAFHLIVTDPTEEVLQNELPQLIREGCSSFKIYMTYDDLKLNDEQILDVLSVAREEGALAMVHAENSDCISWLTKRLLSVGKTRPRFHADARPMLVEREATHRAIALSELVDVPILIVHVSGADAIDQIRWARGKGLNIYAETCPQYLFLTAEDLGLDGFEGAKCVCSPPPRDKKNQEIVWNNLKNGLFTVFSSDHAPFSFEDPRGKKLGGAEVDFPYIPNGIPGIETRLPLLFSEGVGKHRITIHQFVALTSTNPAKLYGLYPRKGSIAIGADADLIIWDSDRELSISNDMLHHNVDYTPYEGFKVKGWPDQIISRGHIVYRDAKVFSDRGRGQFLACGLPNTIL